MRQVEISATAPLWPCHSRRATNAELDQAQMLHTDSSLTLPAIQELMIRRIPSAGTASGQPWQSCAGRDGARRPSRPRGCGGGCTELPCSAIHVHLVARNHKFGGRCRHKSTTRETRSASRRRGPRSAVRGPRSACRVPRAAGRGTGTVAVTHVVGSTALVSNGMPLNVGH